MKISPTSLSTYRKCPRRWAFRYLAGIKFPPTAPLLYGLKFHKIAEAWLKEGTPPDSTCPEGRLFLETIPLLPRPGTALVEESFRFGLDENGIDEAGLNPDAFELFGYIDVLEELGYDSVKVTDHKTSGDPKRWGLTVETLPTNEQGVFYGMGGMLLLDRELAELQWNYANKRRNTAYPVNVTLTRAQAEATLVSWVPIMRDMLRLKETFDSVDPPDKLAWINENVPLRLHACEGVGLLCDYVSHCSLVKLRKKEDIDMAQTAQERLAELRANIGKNKGGNAPEAAQAAEQTAAETTAAAPAQPAATTTAAAPADTQAAETAQPAATTTAAAPATTSDSGKGKGRGKGKGAKLESLADMKAFAEANGVRITIQIG